MFPRPARLIVFPGQETAGPRSIGKVHADGSITFRGHRYRSIKELPSDCKALRADLASEAQWRKLYRAVDPSRRKPS